MMKSLHHIVSLTLPHSPPNIPPHLSSHLSPLLTPLLLSSIPNHSCSTNKRTRYLAPLFLFAFAWFIVGNVWVFKTKKQDCDELVWMTGFWYLIALYILLILILFILVLFCLALFYFISFLLLVSYFFSF